MSRKEEILKQMIIDDEALLEKLVGAAQGIFKVNGQGQVVFLVSESTLSDKQRIGAVLLGRYFAHQLGLSETDSISNKEIAEVVGMAATTVGARLSELRRDRIAESVTRGLWRASVVNMGRFIELLEVK